MLRVYVGPYVRVKVRRAPVPENTPWCVKCDKRHGDTNFCQDCGGVITMKEEIRKLPTPHWTVPATLVLRYAVTDGRFRDHDLDYIYTIGNGTTDFNEMQPDEDKLKKFWHSIGYHQICGATDYQEVVFQEEISWMRARCQKEIESLKRVFGTENVSFGWGLVQNWR